MDARQASRRPRTGSGVSTCYRTGQMSWTVADIPDLTGRLAVVTGANSGLGLETTRELVRRGARVIMAVRNRTKAETARVSVMASVPHAVIELRDLDLASLTSIRAFAAELLTDRTPLDLLVNNAGVMAIPRQTTSDGFEMQFGVNHLGHFALPALLMPVLLAASSARVVNVASSARFFGAPVNALDPHLTHGYDPWRAYGQSKLANVHFTVELESRLRAAGARVSVYASDPGLAATDLQAHSVRETGGRSQQFFLSLVERYGSTSLQGAMPQLRAATDPQATSGRLYGLRFLIRGAPVLVPMLPRERDVLARRTLWAVSERETGILLKVS